MAASKKQVVIIGAGPAGLAAACTLKRLGVQDILILEREGRPGGILRQCIHDGFGLTRFGENLSGPEYAYRFIREAAELGIDIQTETTVLHLYEDKRIIAASPEGMLDIQAESVILAMGCRERTRGALSIPGTRPAGVYTAGVAQNYINLRNKMVGKHVIILGSGDIGMIMARRLTLEGAEVLGVFELQTYPSGLPRNIQQCLNDYHIPLHMSRTVTKVHGKARVTGVTISEVSAENLRAIAGTEQFYACDTLILSVGLIPENELSREANVQIDPGTKGPLVNQWNETTVPGIFAAGNVLHVHDLVDYVSLEAEHTAASIVQYLNGTLPGSNIPVKSGNLIGYVLPQQVCGSEDSQISFRVKAPLRACSVCAVQDGKIIARMKYPKAIPAEMLKMTIRAKNIASDAEIEVMVYE